MTPALALELLEHAPAALVATTAAGEIVFANRCARALFGHEHAPDHLRGRPFDDLLAAPSRPVRSALWAQYQATPAPEADLADIRLRGLHSDGRELDLRLSLGHASTSGETALYLVSCLADVAEGETAAQALATSEARNRALLMAIPDMIFVNRRDGLVVDSKAAPGQLPVPLDQLIGRNLRDIHLPPGIVERYLDTFAQVLDSGEGAVMEYDVDIEGERHYREARITRCGPDEVLVIVRDVTDRTRSEQRIRELNQRLAQQNRELEAFSYSVSHDLLAPLRAIDGFSYIIEDRCSDRLDERGRSLIARIRASARHMSQLIDDLLALARITRTAVERQRIDLSALVTEVLGELGAAAPERHVTTALMPNVLAHGDRSLVRALLHNLLGNAWKYTSTRDQARIGFGVEERAGERVYFVRDNGVGFDMQYADKLFRPFQRLHGSHEFPGTGIGLATAARIVERHGGRIWGESTVGQGTTFYFTLAGASRGEPSAQPVSPASRSGARR